MNAYETQLMERVDRWVDAHAQAMAQDVMELVRYRSVSEKNADVKPYGQACRDVVDRAAAMCAGYGFHVRNHDYRSCTALLKGNTDEQIGIFGHLDVVPEGNDWTFPPFEPFVRDGYIAGRGTSDNKGPAVAALYVMRCLSELKVALNYSVLLFLGAAEEVGMDDIVHYIENNKAPKFSFTPDSMYSVCYGEKGVLNARFARDVAGGNLVAFNGGHVTNSVADRAVAVISGFSLTDVQKAVAGYGDITAREVEDNNGGTKGLGRCVELTAVGVARHAAFPEGSVNAIQRLALALSEQGLVTGAALGAMQFIAGALADNWGTGLDIAFEDEISGATSCIGGLAWMEGTTYHQDINVRYAISADVRELKRRLSARCAEHGFELTLFKDSKPCYIPPDCPLVQMLDQTVGEFYGDRFKPYIMGGGTYARKIPNAVAFGPDVSIEDAPFNGAHQPDEGVCVETLLTAIKIYVLALTRLDAML